MKIQKIISVIVFTIFLGKLQVEQMTPAQIREAQEIRKKTIIQQILTKKEIEEIIEKMRIIEEKSMREALAKSIPKIEIPTAAEIAIIEQQLKALAQQIIQEEEEIPREAKAEIIITIMQMRIIEKIREAQAREAARAKSEKKSEKTEIIEKMKAALGWF